MKRIFLNREELQLSNQWRKSYSFCCSNLMPVECSFSWNWIIKSKNSFSFSTLFKQPLNKIKEGFMLTMKIYSKWCFCCFACLFKQPLNKIKEGFMLTMKIYSKWCFCCFAWILIGMHYWQVICLYTSCWALNVTKVILKVNHHSSSCIAGSKLLIGCDDFYASKHPSDLVAHLFSLPSHFKTFILTVPYLEIVLGLLC